MIERRTNERKQNHQPNHIDKLIDDNVTEPATINKNKHDRENKTNMRS